MHARTTNNKTKMRESEVDHWLKQKTAFALRRIKAPPCPWMFLNIYWYSTTPVRHLRYGKRSRKARSCSQLEALAQAGFSYILEPWNAKIFVQPRDFKIVCVDLHFRNDIKRDFRLRPSTVVVSESYRPALAACMNGLKSSKPHKIYLKNTIELYPYDESW